MTDREHDVTPTVGGTPWVPAADAELARAEPGYGLDEREERLVEAAVARIREAGPMTLDDLAADLGESDADELDDLLTYTDNGLMFDRRRRWYHADDQLVGMVFTHRTTPEDLRRGVLQVDPDLALFATGDHDAFPLAGGGEAVLDLDERDANGVLRGPDGWLERFDVDELVAVSWDGVTMGVQPVDEVDEPSDDLPRSLRRILEEERARSRVPLVGLGSLLMEHAFDHPGAFSHPRRPVGEALSEAGLFLDGTHIFVEGENPSDIRRGIAIAQIRDDQPWLDERQAEGVLAVARALRSHEVIADQPTAREVNAWLVDDEVAPAAAVELCGTYGWAIATVEDRIGDIERTLGERELSAGVWWLRAHRAEHLGDGELCERYLLAALGVDPEFAPALVDRADLVEDRGDAAGALKLLRQADVRTDDLQYETLETFAQPGPLSAGRNEPCPCGSGRKYKVCCSRHRGWSQWDRLRWLLERLARFQHRPSQRGRLLQVSDTFAVGDDAEERRLEALNDPLVLGLALFEAGGIAEYLALRGHVLQPDEYQLLLDWSECRFDAYAVVVAEDDGHVTLESIRSGRRHRLRDRGLRELAPATVVGTWVLPVDDVAIVGFAATPVADLFVDDLLETLEEAEDGWELPWLPVAAWLESQDMLRRLVARHR